MAALILLVGALVPSALLLWFLISRDRNPEPRGVLVRTFLLGVVIVAPAYPVATLLEAAGGFLDGRFPGAFRQGVLGAAIPEELFKFAVLRWYVWRHPAFDEPIDGLVYGATASLGFATLENLMYVGEGGAGVAVLRAFTAVPGHASWGVIMGAYVGMARFAPPEARRTLLVRGVVAAIALHGAYDFLLFTASAWALLAPVVLVYGAVWALRLVKPMRAAQLTVHTESVVLATPDVIVEASVTEVQVRRAPPARSAWGIVKLVLGSLGLTTVALFECVCVIGLLDASAEHAARVGLTVFAVLAAGIGVGCFFLFRSGLRLRPS